MARYTCSYRVKAPLDRLKALLEELFQACNFELLYNGSDYMMVREPPGQVNFSKLVMVEVFVDTTTASSSEVQIDLVVKNEELPLQVNNHCRQLFDMVQQIVAEDYQWQLVNNASD